MALRNRANEAVPMSRALTVRMPPTYSTMTAFMRASAAVARSMTLLMREKMTPRMTRAQAKGTSVASASGAFTEHRKAKAATGPVRYMNASGMLCAKNSSNRSTSSTSTVLIRPTPRSSSAPSGAWAKWSITRQRTSKSVLYAPLWDSTLEAAKHAYWSTQPTAVSRALSRRVEEVHVPS